MIMRSNVLHMHLVKAIGRLLFGFVLSFPGLGTGIIVASFQDFGTLPVSQMSLNVFRRTEREESERCFKNW